MIVMIVCVLIAGCIRLTRWLSIVQQKEYRWDRVRTYLFSVEGLREIVRFFPRMSDFTRTGLKRPKISARIAVVTLLSLIILCSLFYLVNTLLEARLAQTTSSQLVRCIIVLSFYICIPLIVLLSTIPTTIISYVQTAGQLVVAKRKLNQHHPLIVGITGSYGKTATKQLLAHLLSQKQSVFVTPKSYNTRFSIARSILQQYHSEKIVILEYGAYSRGEIANLARWFQPSVAIITGLASQHLGLFGSKQAIIEAKSELIAALPSDGAVFYNQSDQGAQTIVKMGVKKWQRKYGTKDGLTITGCNSLISKNNFRFSLNSSGYLHVLQGNELIQTRLVGLQHAQTVELAATCARSLNLADSSLLEALRSFEPSDNFIKLLKTKSGTTIIDDGGTANPVGFQAALALLDHIVAEKKLLITPGIVDLGRESASIHTALALQSKSSATMVLFVGWTGRTEFQAVFGDQCITNQAEITTILHSLDSKDVVLIEGRMPGWVSQAIKTI